MSGSGRINRGLSPFDSIIGTIEAALGQTAKKNFLPMQDGDVQATYADVDDLIRDTGFKPATTLEYGIGDTSS
jgi:UDP-glucuronate 4-epimerase